MNLPSTDVIQGTLDMLILKTLSLAPRQVLLADADGPPPARRGDGDLAGTCRCDVAAADGGGLSACRCGGN
jgi:hypothetical protein